MIFYRKRYLAALAQARRLLAALSDKHFGGIRLETQPDLEGVLDQIDNATSMLILPTRAKPDACTLIDIRTEGRNRILTFMRGGKSWEITVYAAMSDNVAEWRKNAGLELP